MNNESKKFPNMNRRDCLRFLLGTAAIGTLPALSWSDDSNEESSSIETVMSLATTGLNANIVVVGGGMGGVTVAKYLRLWGGSGLNVTLVEPEPAYTSHIMSNLVLNGTRTLNSLYFDYTKLSTRYGVTVKRASLVSVNSGSRTVSLSDGSSLSYDRLVLSPGVEFDNAYGLTQNDYNTLTPHAWRAGPQTQLLRDQLQAMPVGGTFVMTIPKAPYRCPPGPYERACLIADYLKTAKGAGSKVIVLDENSQIQAEKENFTTAFNVLHAGVIDYRPSVTNISIDPNGKSVSYSGGSISANVVNPIPPHRATGSDSGGWLAAAGLNNGTGGRWAAVNVLSYESTVVPKVHIIGDAAQTGLPKAGHIANQEAKICADAIVRLLAGGQPDPAPVANSACYSPVTASTASWLTAVYQYDAPSSSMKVASNVNGVIGSTAAGAGPVEAATFSSKNFSQMNGWFASLMGDSFM